MPIIDCQDRIAWLKERQFHVMEEDGIALIEQKTREVYHDKLHAIEDSEAEYQRFWIHQIMKVGMLQIYQQLSGNEVEIVDPYQINALDTPSVACSLDGWGNDSDYGYLPVIVRNSPFEVQTLAHHQILATGSLAAHVLILDGSDASLTVVERDQDVCNGLLDFYAEFWGYVEDGVMPPAREIKPEPSTNGYWPRLPAKQTTALRRTLLEEHDKCHLCEKKLDLTHSVAHFSDEEFRYETAFLLCWRCSRESQESLELNLDK